ncbi:MAG: DUF2283 domain-containing protein [Candidatus Xenobia bacterium]
MQPRITYTGGDILFLQFTDEKTVNTLEPAPQVLVDVDGKGRVVSVEIIGASVMPLKRVMDVFQQFGITLEYPLPQQVAS